MERMKYGLTMAMFGVVLFLVSFFLILPVAEFYILSLVLMFSGVVLIGIGGAFAKGFDKSLDTLSDDCYYCKGTGKKDGPDGKQTCPRCGGTGLAREDD